MLSRLSKIVPKQFFSCYNHLSTFSRICAKVQILSLTLAFNLIPLQANEQSLVGEKLESWTTAKLEKRLAEMDSQLKNLASLSLRGGIGSIGYRSYWREDSQWIEIELDQNYSIDEIILVPCLWRHPTKGFMADAFPNKIRVLGGGEDSNSSGTLLAEYIVKNRLHRNLEPLILSVSGKKASRIRIEATELTARHFDGQKVLQLAEILIFSDSKNVALRRPLKCSSSDRRGMSGAWNEQYLVDGFLPYLMDSATGDNSIAFIGTIEDETILTLDLGSRKPVSAIHMHAVEQNDTVPQAYFGDLGIPKHMLIEGSNTSDFSDKVLLLDYKRESLNETGPIIMLPVKETTCRYIRFVPLESNISNRFGFAEIEVISNGENVALGKPVIGEKLDMGTRKLKSLTDGNNLYGKILPMKVWMEELALRGSLESERPMILAELNRRYARQKVVLSRLYQLVLILGIGICFIILIDRHFRLRKVSQVRERIAADLHDDLGANIHTIGLISDMARHSLDSRSETIELLDQIREFTERSGEAARYCTNILEARGICENLVEEMSKFSERILADMEHQISFVNEELLHKITPHKRVDLFLFYKECLTNILRHSGATKVMTRLTVDSKILTMSVTDNGKGLQETTQGTIPHSIKRRAKLLRAKVSTEHPDTGGTRITLRLKTRKFGGLK